MRGAVDGDVADALHDRLRGLDLGVLADDNGGAEGWLARFVAAVLNAGGAHGATVVGGLQFVPVKFLLGVVALAVALDQHDREVGYLRKITRSRRRRGFRGVETFVVASADQLPEKFHQRGLAGAGFADQLKERIRLLFLADLLRENRTEPKGQCNESFGAEACPHQVKPLVTGRVAIAADGQLRRVREGFEVEPAYVEVVFVIQLVHRAILNSEVAEDVGLVVFGVPDVIDGLHGFDPEQLNLDDSVELLTRACPNRARRDAQKSLLELARAGQTSAGECALDGRARMRERDAVVVPALVRDRASLKIK